SGRDGLPNGIAQVHSLAHVGGLAADDARLWYFSAHVFDGGEDGARVHDVRVGPRVVARPRVDLGIDQIDRAGFSAACGAVDEHEHVDRVEQLEREVDAAD